MLKLHALTDTKGRPRVLLLTPGNINDIAMALALLSEAGRPIRRVLGDKGYDANSLRDLLAAQRTIAVIPSTASRKVPIPHDARTYRQRNLVERMFCRLKDYRRVATRYDKLARNFLAGTLIAAALTWWLDSIQTLGPTRSSGGGPIPPVEGPRHHSFVALRVRQGIAGGSGGPVFPLWPCLANPCRTTEPG